MNGKSPFAAYGIVLAAVMCSTQAFAQSDVVTTKRATELHDAPGETSRSLAQLPPQTPVTRLGPRQGPWIEVRTTQGSSGWVHMFDIGSTLPAQGGNSATGALRSLTSFFGKGSPQAPATTTATATIGIRGLGAEDIANAQPNLEAVTRAEGLRQNAAQARQFGTGASLVGMAVDPLPVPAPATQSAGGQAGNTMATPANQGSAR
jgi:hypothetical protein